jgi:hypothetical protein
MQGWLRFAEWAWCSPGGSRLEATTSSGASTMLSRLTVPTVPSMDSSVILVFWHDLIWQNNWTTFFCLAVYLQWFVLAYRWDWGAVFEQDIGDHERCSCVIQEPGLVGIFIPVHPWNFSVYGWRLTNLCPFLCQGGFDLLGRSIDQIRTSKQVSAAMATCRSLNLDGLVIVGGTNTTRNRDN